MQSAESDSAKSFRSMGVEFLTAQGTARPLEQIMLNLADAFAKLPEGGARTTAAMNLLGRSGTDLIPTLVQGSKAIGEQMERMKAYGVTVNQSTANVSGEWNDSMDEMGLAWQGLKLTLGEAIEPALLPVMRQVLEWTQTHQPQIRHAIQDTVQAVVDASKALAPPIEWMGNHWRQLAAVAGGVTAYMVGPAVLGGILKLAPALFAIVEPTNAVRLGILGIKSALDPTSLPLKLLATGLGLVTAYAIEQPGALKALHTGWQYLAVTAGYVGDVIRKVLLPTEHHRQHAGVG